MSNWTGTKRRPQQPSFCPPGFEGSKRYVTNDECPKPVPAPPSHLVFCFGKHKGKAPEQVDSGYLQWFIRDVKGHKRLKRHIRRVLAKRGVPVGQQKHRRKRKKPRPKQGDRAGPRKGF